MPYNTHCRMTNTSSVYTRYFRHTSALEGNRRPIRADCGSKTSSRQIQKSHDLSWSYSPPKLLLLRWESAHWETTVRSSNAVAYEDPTIRRSHPARRFSTLGACI